MRLHYLTLIVFFAVAISGCLSQEARAYRESQNRHFNAEDVVLRNQQRAAKLFPEVYATSRAAFDRSEPITTPKLVYSVSPKYPKGLARKEVQGGVCVAFVVDEAGVPIEVQALEDESMPADPKFVEAALGAVRQWRFSPGKAAGKPMRFILTVPMLFEMHDGI